MTKKKKLSTSSLPSFGEIFNMLKTFALVMFTFVIFKSNSITEAFHFYKSLFSKSLFSVPKFDGVSMIYFVSLILYIFFLFGMEWNARKKEHVLENFGVNLSKPIRWSVYSGLVLIVYYFSSIVSNQDFIYFQF
jgi:hypothetical protein